MHPVAGSGEEGLRRGPLRAGPASRKDRGGRIGEDARGGPWCPSARPAAARHHGTPLRRGRHVRRHAAPPPRRDAARRSLRAEAAPTLRRHGQASPQRAAATAAAEAPMSGAGGASEAACTPGSVPLPEGRGDGHPSGAAGRPAAHAADPRAPAARRCPGGPGRALLFGLAPGRACRVSPRRRSPGRGLVSVALVLASRRTGVTRYPAPWSPDVPHAAGCPATRDRPAASLTPRFYPAAPRSSATAVAIARPRTPCAAPSRWTPSAASVATSAPASRNAAPDWRAASR